jgi:hypothetical protein
LRIESRVKIVDWLVYKVHEVIKYEKKEHVNFISSSHEGDKAHSLNHHCHTKETRHAA